MNELSPEYGDREEQDTFFCRKTLIGSGNCYQSIDVELTFDHLHKVINQQITGGKFISEAEYLGKGS